MNRVKVNSKYVYEPNLMDKIDPPYGIKDGLLKEGQVVKVVNKYGCPKANTMGMCYIESLDGEFLGMVCTNSLERRK